MTETTGERAFNLAFQAEQDLVPIHNHPLHHSILYHRLLVGKVEKHLTIAEEDSNRDGDGGTLVYAAKSQEVPAEGVVGVPGVGQIAEYRTGCGVLS